MSTVSSRSFLVERMALDNL